MKKEVLNEIKEALKYYGEDNNIYNSKINVIASKSGQRGIKLSLLLDVYIKEKGFKDFDEALADAKIGYLNGWKWMD